MKRKNSKTPDRLTYTQAFDYYFGGMKKVAQSTIPFYCICKIGVFGIEDMWRHIREAHHERLKRVAL